MIGLETQPPLATIVPSTRRERALAMLLLAGALLYLMPFVDRGWIAHDEGMTGQAAERVLAGQLPHVDYEEPYTGGLALAHAVAFRAAGVDLLNLRWLLFGVAAVTQFLTYSLLRRLLPAAAAALATLLAFVWTFPNYFAAMPSWWVLALGVFSLWALTRFHETSAWRYLILAGVLVGCAIVIKQTGAYLAVGLAWAVVSQEDRGAGHGRSSLLRTLTGSIALAGTIFAASIISARPWPGELLFLMLPIVSVAALVAFAPNPGRHALARVTVVALSASAPLLLFLIPYGLRGELWGFFNGAVLLPQKRVSFASMPMPTAANCAIGIAVLGFMVYTPSSFSKRETALLVRIKWAVAVLLPIASLWAMSAYQFIVMSARAAGAIAPVAAAWLVISGRVPDPGHRFLLTAGASLLAWASLVQFPYATAIYFSYVVPLGVITGVAVLQRVGLPGSSGLRAWVVMAALFALLSANRGYVNNFGTDHVRQQLDVPLGLRKASLTVSPMDAAVYTRLMSRIGPKLPGAKLLAGPDCPEVYFLADRFSPSGNLFDFFAGDSAGGSVADETLRAAASVIVVNRYPEFSPAPPPALLHEIRREFPHGEDIGRFEVRWR